ncbi:uncharacterized protein ACA1_386210 [Acanthamoeba castellanii str. Neff]|uniref:Uncharacterized protein n=1 Tax=Acanthamoeba castellanii (strain ATCC 30010 / Neff) TaxID=1257118 RepID=L8HAR8_ACACF|nr:uncharacterized protein ACA1_386210 [Acanthamoeba castellanii str. Neff]ELR21823.1 hypothetical protein ACA1_386210 [Acanthamoeba castellanii str. Neff]
MDEFIHTPLVKRTCAKCSRKCSCDDSYALFWSQQGDSINVLRAICLNDDDEFRSIEVAPALLADLEHWRSEHKKNNALGWWLPLRVEDSAKLKEPVKATRYNVKPMFLALSSLLFVDLVAVHAELRDNAYMFAVFGPSIAAAALLKYDASSGP